MKHLATRSLLARRTGTPFLSVLLLALMLVAAGCDSAGEPEAAAADLPTSTLAKGDDTVIIGAPGSTQGDFLFHPVEIPAGGAFIIDLIGGPSPYSILASVLHRGLQNGETEVEVDLSGIGGQFAVDMRLDETVLHRTSALAASETQPIGSLREPPTSFHFSVIYEGDERVIVVAVDYDRGTDGGGGVAWVTPEAGGEAVPTSYLDILPQRSLAPGTEIAGVRMRGIGTGEIVVAEQHVQ